MPYTAPTATEFKTRYPAFAAVGDSVVTAAITEANRFVDNGWFEADYQPAIMAMAAHILVTDGELGDATNTVGLIQSEKLGDASITYASGAGGSTSEFAQTSYGRKFLRMQRVNVPAVVLI